MSEKPKTLGEYRDLSSALGAHKAVEFFDKKIEKQGRDALVIVHESQMLFLIHSMMETS